MGCMLADLGITLAGSKHCKGDELPRYGLHCLYAKKLLLLWYQPRSIIRRLLYNYKRALNKLTYLLRRACARVVKWVQLTLAVLWEEQRCWWRQRLVCTSWLCRQMSLTSTMERRSPWRTHTHTSHHTHARTHNSSDCAMTSVYRIDSSKK